MELTQLRYFIEVADSLHMTESAARLHVAQPALSQAISRLERELGVMLFERVGRRLALTACGRFLRDRLRSPLSVLETIPRELAEMQEKESRTVRLNVVAASVRVTDAIIAYHRLHPEVQFSLLQGGEPQDCDLTVTTTFPGENRREDAFVLEESIFLAVPTSGKYAGRDAISLAEVADEDFISLAGSRQFRSICDRFCMQAGFTPRTVFESDNLASVRNLIAARAGIGFWPEFSFGSPEIGAVRLLPISEPVCSRHLVIVRQRRESAGCAADFYDFLCRFFTELKEKGKRE